MLPSGDFYLCKTCYDQAIDFVGDPTVHHWNTVHVEVEGLGAETTYVVERCRICGDLRVNTDTKVVEWVGDDDPNETEPIPDAEAEAEGRRAEAADDDTEPVVHEPYSGTAPSSDQ